MAHDEVHATTCVYLSVPGRTSARRTAVPRSPAFTGRTGGPGRKRVSCATNAPRCARDELINLGGHREPGHKIKVLDYFDFNLSRCSFCGLCAEVCPTKPVKALIMSEDYELGSYSRNAQILRVDEMYDGVPIERYTR